jgi:hypothetical protein
MKPVIVETGEDVEMEMPDVLITGRAIVLTRGDPLATSCILQCARDQASRAKEVLAQIVWYVQCVLEVKPRDDKTITADPRVVV